MTLPKSPRPIQSLVLDWDYDTFTVACDDDGNPTGEYYLWDDRLTAEDQQVYLEGWPWCGKGLERTLFERVPDKLFLWRPMETAK